jgi:hypothetical protein
MHMLLTWRPIKGPAVLGLDFISLGGVIAICMHPLHQITHTLCDQQLPGQS